MSKNSKLTAVLLSAAIAVAANASAQNSTGMATTSSSEAAQMQKAPADMSPPANIIVDTPTPPAKVMDGSSTATPGMTGSANPSMAHPVDNINIVMNSAMDAPKADGSVIDKLVSHYNNKDVDGVVSMFSKDGFVVIGNNGEMVKDADGLKKMLNNMFAGDKKLTYTAQVDNVKDIVPGVAMVTSHYNVFDEANTASSMGKVFTVTVVKYQDNAWKIVSQQATGVMKDAMMMNKVENHQSNNGIKMVIIALIGAAIGFVAAKFIPKRNNITLPPQM